MKKIKKLLLVSLFLTSVTIFGQTRLTGTVVDESNEPLPSASVVVKGTSNGTSTDFDGKFILNAISDSGVIAISFVGYKTKEVTFSKSKANLGIIQLDIDENALEEIVISGVIDIVKDRSTPIAVSTIKAAEIQERLGAQELPELLNATPSVYATKQGGGFGDSRINIRGFDQANTAVLINGQPVNDMENGWVYWSNWAGLAEVTTVMQVQRGLGASKLAISSVGGTINIVTKSTDKKQGGSVKASFGNDSFMKYSASYNTGKLDNGFAVSLLLSTFSGDGYIDGTKGQGQNYFIGLGYDMNQNHNFQFIFTGAPQWHNQHSWASRLSDYIKYGDGTDPDRKYNSDWGYLDGKEYTWRRNFYHKPVMSLNWDWTINETSGIYSSFYASWGRGGGTGPIGRINGSREFSSKFRNDDGLVRFDDIQKWNSGKSVSDFGKDRNSPFTNDRSNGFTRRASMNSHNWYGLLANYNNKLNDNLTFDFGVDLRTYKGIHYRVVNDVLGASGYTDSRDRNNPNRDITKFVEASPSFNPWQNITNQQKIEYYNDGDVRWYGAFTQLEYKNDKISTFVQAGISQQGFKRIDYFNLGSYNDTSQSSDFKNISGGNIKTGISYNVNDNGSVYGNVGYYSKQPNFRAIYPNFTDNNLNDRLINEKVLGSELGYKFQGENISLNVNLYRTSWKDRYFQVSSNIDVNNTPENRDDDVRGTARLNGVEQVHTGIEFDAIYNPVEKLQLTGMLSVGDWKYNGKVEANYIDENNDPILVNGSPEIKTLYLDGKKVGDAAQLTSRLAARYKITDNFKVDGSWALYNNLYAAIDATAFSSEDKESLKLPSYNLMDLGFSYKLKFDSKNKNSLNFRLNINNLFDKTYISESDTSIDANTDDTKNWNGINTANRVFFGFGRTWNVSVSFRF